MIRRPSRTALHSALSALSGGLRGVAAQRQQAEERAQRDILNQRNALRDALDLAESGAMVATPEQLAAETPPPTVTLGEQRYVVPSLEERAKRRAAAEEQARAEARRVQLQEAEREREAQNRRAYGAARMTMPNIVTAESEYDPTVDYQSVLGYRQPTAPRSTQLTPNQAIAEADKERLGLGYMVEFADPEVGTFTEDERSRFWRAFRMLQQNNPLGASDGRLAYSAFQTIRTGTQQSAMVDANERAAADAERAARRGFGGVNVPPPPGMQAAPDSSVAPAQPAPAAAPVTPAQPAPAAPAAAARPKVGYTADDYDAALDALGPEATVDEVSNWLRVNRPLNRTP